MDRPTVVDSEGVPLVVQRMAWVDSRAVAVRLFTGEWQHLDWDALAGYCGVCQQTLRDMFRSPDPTPVYVDAGRFILQLRRAETAAEASRKKSPAANRIQSRGELKMNKTPKEVNEQLAEMRDRMCWLRQGTAQFLDPKTDDILREAENFISRMRYAADKFAKTGEIPVGLLAKHIGASKQQIEELEARAKPAEVKAPKTKRIHPALTAYPRLLQRYLRERPEHTTGLCNWLRRELCRDDPAAANPYGVVEAYRRARNPGMDRPEYVSDCGGYTEEREQLATGLLEAIEGGYFRQGWHNDDWHCELLLTSASR